MMRTSPHTSFRQATEPPDDRLSRSTGADGQPPVRSVRDGLIAAATQETAVRYHLLLKSARDPILFVGYDGQILEVNPAAEAVYGYSRQEFLGLKIFHLRAEETLTLVSEQMAQAIAGGLTFETVHRHKDGTSFPVEVSSSASSLGGEQMLLSIIRPIARRQNLEKLHKLLHELDSAVLAKQPLEQLMEQTCGRICALFELAAAWIGLPRQDGTVSVVAGGGTHLPFLDQLQIRWDDTLLGHNPTGLALRTGQPQPVTRADPERLGPWLDPMREHGLVYALALPIIYEGLPLGALTICHTTVPPCDQELAGLMAHFANRAAISIMAARDQEQLLLQRAALDAAANAVTLTDREGKIRWANPAWERLTGYPVAEVIGQTPSILKSGRHDSAYYAAMWKQILSGEPWMGTMWNRRKDGSFYLDEQTITPVRDARGDISHFIAIKQDVTDRKRLEERLQHLANHDPLTDLPNRRLLDEWAWQQVADAAVGQRGALLLVGIDRFKFINDSVGPLIGDQLLVSLAHLLRTVLRQHDLLARMGGDEFAVLLPNTDLDEAQAVGERVRRSIDEHRFQISGSTVSLRVSIGISQFEGNTSPIQVQTEAYAAFHAAKERGGNRVVSHRSLAGRDPSAPSRGLWVTRVKDALRENRMRLHYQPIVHLRDRSVVCHEVLVRMVDEAGALQPPASFLPAAEEFGLMRQLDGWVVRRALESLKRAPTRRLFINLSAQSLSDDCFLTEIEQEIRAAAIEPGRLTFEITETAAVKDIFFSQQAMHRLNDLGCSFALDDFGTGFSSFRYLRELPVHYVKIDGIFVQDLEADPVNRSLVRAMATAAQEMGKTVIAEWVESPEAARLLTEMGVEYGQGFHFGHPQSEAV